MDDDLVAIREGQPHGRLAALRRQREGLLDGSQGPGEGEADLVAEDLLLALREGEAEPHPFLVDRLLDRHVGDVEGRLVRTPLMPGIEVRALIVELVVAPSGEARGVADVQVTGDLAARFFDLARDAPPELMEASARSVFSGLLPGVDIDALNWKVHDDACRRSRSSPRCASRA